MTKFTKENAYLEDGIYLPKSLFCDEDSESRNISPAATLNPAAALSGAKGFQSSTTPNQKHQKRALIIDRNSFAAHPENGERMALLKRFQNAGFEVFLRCSATAGNPSNFYKLGEDLKVVSPQLQNLSTFNSATDYNDLAHNHHLAQSKTLVLDNAADVFNQNRYYGRIVGNDWRGELIQDELAERTLADKGGFNSPNNGYYGIKEFLYASDVFYEKTAFLLQQLSAEQEPEVLSEILRVIGNNLNKNGSRYLKDFVPGTILVLNAVPHLKTRLLAEFDSIIKNSSNDEISNLFTTEDLILNHIDSVEEVVGALKIFPHRKDVLQTFINTNKDGKLATISQLIENFPETKSQLVQKLRSQRRISLSELETINLADYENNDVETPPLSNTYDCFVTEILADIYEGKETESCAKFERLLNAMNRSSADNYQAKYEYFRLCFKALKDGEAKTFYESKLVENFKQDLEENFTRYSMEGSTQTIAKIIEMENVSPQVTDEIISLIYNADKYENKFYYQASLSYRPNPVIVSLIKTRPQRAQEFLEAISEGYTSILINELPASINKYCRDTNLSSRLQDLADVNYLSSDLAHPKQTYLDLANLGIKGNLSALEQKMDSGDLDNVAVVKITSSDLERDEPSIYSFLKNFCTKRQSPLHFILSENLEKAEDLVGIIKNSGDQFSYEFFDYENYLGIKALIEAEQASEHGNREESNLPQSKKIRISINTDLTKFDPSNHETSQFVNATAGEVLNGYSDGLLIRTSIVQRNLATSIEQQEYLAQNFTNVENLQSLNAEKIESLNYEDPRQGIFCQFSQQLTAGKEFRLLSANATESLVGLVGETEGVKIRRGDDDFFYATASTNQVLTYVIKAPNPQLDQSRYNQLSKSHPIRKIIDEYRNDPRYLRIADPENKVGNYEEMGHEEWMADAFENRSGSCRHRVAAVEYKLKTNGISEENFRSVNINGNHIILEIKGNDNKWIKVDVGGSNTTEVNLDEIQTYTTKPVADATPTNHSILAALTPTDLPQTDSKNENSELTQSDQALVTMARAFLSKSKFTVIKNQKDLKAQTLNPENSNILVATSAIEQHGNFFLEQAKNMERPIFYIDHPSKIDLGRKNIFINDLEVPIVEKNGLLGDFLENAQGNPIILINWAAFAPAQKLALNSALDLNRKINGVAIGESFQVIGICQDLSQDPSFLSRHHKIINSEVDLFRVESKNSQDCQTIDLQGFLDWRRHLFGKVVVEGEKMTWEKSDFIKKIESGKSNFEIVNLSPEAAQELQYELGQATAAGTINYHGHEIICPKNLKVACGNAAFEFGKFSEKERISLAKNVTFDQTPQENCHLVNTYLFDILLCDKKIEKGQYFEEKGLLAKCAESEDKNLKLFISSDLSESQWYCLFNQAQEKGVKLELYLAPEIELPSNVVVSTAENYHKREEITSPTILVTNNPSQVLESLEPQFAVIDVEDFTYQDLIEKIDFEIDENGFKNFTKTPSQFLTALQAGEKITLKGEFSPDLLQMLEPVLATIGKNLTLIIEDKSSVEGQVYPPLKWLPQSAYTVTNPTNEIAPATALPYLESWKSAGDLSNSANEAADFIRQRKNKITSALQNNSMIQLVGYSGVGKSGIIKELEESGAATIYRELGAFEKWATEPSDKPKILFIDESNIENFHFTKFSPLKNGGNRRVLHEGKFYDLGPNDKVVFACNPADFGGGRNVQKLFENGEVPAIELRDFPQSYIYEKILKESIYEKLQNKIPEEQFKEICQPLILEYQKINSRKKSEQDANEETVRELQEKVLRQLVKDQIVPEIKTANFISTSATKEVETDLLTSLTIRQKQRVGEFPTNAVGLNGILLEGDAGIGKSELINAALAAKGITEKKFNQEETATKSKEQHFYKIDASLPLDQKRAIIVRAFEEGNVVWIDEINSCIDDGLEKVLNAALTGDHPDGKKDEVTAGFMLISSVNSIGLEGRSLISPALRHRVISPKVQGLKEYSQEDLTKIVEHWVEQKTPPLNENHNTIAATCQNIAEDFQICRNSKGGSNLNLRMLKSSLEEILPDYVKSNLRPSPSMHHPELGSVETEHHILHL